MFFSKPRITYFPVAARAETARLILEETGVDYEFNMITDWTNQKPALSDVLPFGQLPLYQDNEISLVQSQAINRYLAKKHGLAGSNAVERAKIDSLVEGIEEVYSKCNKVKYSGSDDSKAEALKILLSDLPKHLEIFGNILKSNSSGFLVGSAISYADLHFFFVLKTMISGVKETIDIISNNPQVKEFSERIAARPKIKAYYEKAPYGF